jgi:hypothetical protein
MTSISLTEVADFILGYDLIYRTWERDSLLDWLRWHSAQGFILRALGDNGELLGIAIVRPMMRKECYSERLSYHFDNEGDTYFVDLAIAARPKLKVLQALGFAGLRRFGARKYMAFQVRAGSIKIIEPQDHRAKLLKRERLCKT